MAKETKLFPDNPDDEASPYVVLARKYRPQTFADLIGQEAMVQTLQNAFAADRISQVRSVIDPTTAER